MPKRFTKRSEGARRGWETRRAAARAAKRVEQQRAAAARRGWETRRRNARRSEEEREAAKGERERRRKGRRPARILPEDVDEYAELHGLELHDAYDILYGYADEDSYG